jgi:hypothetical protein
MQLYSCTHVPKTAVPEIAIDDWMLQLGVLQREQTFVSDVDNLPFPMPRISSYHVSRKRWHEQCVSNPGGIAVNVGCV